MLFWILFQAEFDAALSDEDSDDDTFGAWTKFLPEEPINELPLLITLPYAKAALEDLDPDIIDPVPQVLIFLLCRRDLQAILYTSK